MSESELQADIESLTDDVSALRMENAALNGKWADALDALSAALAAKEAAEAERDRLQAILDQDWVAATDHVKVIKRAFDAEAENERLLIRAGAAVDEARQWRAVVENRSVSDLVARAERAEAQVRAVEALCETDTNPAFTSRTVSQIRAALAAVTPPEEPTP